MLQHQWWQAQR